MFLSPLGERLGEGVNAKVSSCITPSPSLSPKGERSLSFARSGALPAKTAKTVDGRSPVADTDR
jgi:hypothetical protein